MKVRSALAAVALAGAVVPLSAQTAHAMMCPLDLYTVCGTLGVVCGVLEDSPKIPDCPPLG